VMGIQRRPVLFITAVLFIPLTILLFGCASTNGIRSYPYHFYETTGPNQFIVVNGKEKVLVFHINSNQDAIIDLRNLRWNVLYPNSQKIMMEGKYQEDGEFVLEHWYLLAPFERLDLKDKDDPLGEKVSHQKTLLDQSDFEKKTKASPGSYNKP